VAVASIKYQEYGRANLNFIKENEVFFEGFRTVSLDES
jgi:hypothetical protein